MDSAIGAGAQIVMLALVRSGTRCCKGLAGRLTLVESTKLVVKVKLVAWLELTNASKQRRASGSPYPQCRKRDAASTLISTTTQGKEHSCTRRAVKPWDHAAHCCYPIHSVSYLALSLRQFVSLAIRESGACVCGKPGVVTVFDSANGTSRMVKLVTRMDNSSSLRPHAGCLRFSDRL